MDVKNLYTGPYHPVDTFMKRDFSGRVRRYTRTQRPPKYYFIDFGLRRRYDPSKGTPWSARRQIGVYTKLLQSLITMIKTKTGFDFLNPLVDDIVQNDPNARPTMDVVVERFDSDRQ
ncbi:uncharacterized protein F5147DRAFT_776700 [Suillus discolor]|uniref:Protein kinase domain-containing protein n=1 Tax=Suillus discolor TaxID=1912936 RepID=A0A9P7F0C8_9AGAM|nr:uncharacterized protein F5147DRAFT_776700 [Suillus discolor]KAG2101351.1 hypothetical protein F5147DRAFT_776700 [Suillus discolor]